MDVARLRRIVANSIAGFGSQNFLGAPWFSGVLRLAPARSKRRLALELLALSPHYFYRTPLNDDMNHVNFLEAEFVRNTLSRETIIQRLVQRHLAPDCVVVDFGCGPGFLARAAAARVLKVYAIDISSGVLAAASAINGAPNIEFLRAKDGAIPLSDGVADLIYSFAVVQHVTDGVFSGMLKEWYRILRPGGTVLCHIAIDEEGWKTESELRQDRSLAGLIRWRFGLHCFSRSEEAARSAITAARFDEPQIIRIGDLDVPLDDDINHQHLCVFTKPTSGDREGNTALPEEVSERGSPLAQGVGAATS